VRTGRGEQALEAHRSAYRRIRDNPHHLAELALNLLFCCTPATRAAAST
jgi:hypothetical protein